MDDLVDFPMKLWMCGSNSFKTWKLESTWITNNFGISGSQNFKNSNKVLFKQTWINFPRSQTLNEPCVECLEAVQVDPMAFQVNYAVNNLLPLHGCSTLACWKPSSMATNHWFSKEVPSQLCTKARVQSIAAIPIVPSLFRIILALSIGPFVRRQPRSAGNFFIANRVEVDVEALYNLPCIRREPFAELRRRKAFSTGLLFLDLTQAFYRVLREVPLGGCVSDELLAHLMHKLHMPADSLHDIHELLEEQPALDQAGLDPIQQQRCFRAIRKSTHFWLPDQADVSRTTMGTRPADSFADIVFGYMWSIVLAKLEKYMVEHDFIQPLEMHDQLPLLGHSFSRPDKTYFVGPTWMDDLAICVLSPLATDLPHRLGQVASFLLDLCRYHCLSPNLSPGKTELLMTFRGRNSRHMKIRHYGPQAPWSLPVVCECETVQLPLVTHYKHLGGVCHHAGDQRTELKQRFAIAHQALSQHRKLLYHNKCLPFDKPAELFQMLVSTKLLYGADSWIAIDQASQDRFHTGIIKLYRRLLRIPAGQHCTDDGILVWAAMPTASTLQTSLLCDLGSSGASGCLDYACQRFILVWTFGRRSLLDVGSIEAFLWAERPQVPLPAMAAFGPNQSSILEATGSSCLCSQCASVSDIKYATSIVKLLTSCRGFYQMIFSSGMKLWTSLTLRSMVAWNVSCAAKARQGRTPMPSRSTTDSRTFDNYVIIPLALPASSSSIPCRNPRRTFTTMSSAGPCYRDGTCGAPPHRAADQWPTNFGVASMTDFYLRWDAMALGNPPQDVENMLTLMASSLTLTWWQRLTRQHSSLSMPQQTSKIVLFPGRVCDGLCSSSWTTWALRTQRFWKKTQTWSGTSSRSLVTRVPGRFCKTPSRNSVQPVMSQSSKPSASMPRTCSSCLTTVPRPFGRNRVLLHLFSGRRRPGCLDLTAGDLRAPRDLHWQLLLTLSSVMSLRKLHVTLAGRYSKGLGYFNASRTTLWVVVPCSCCAHFDRRGTSTAWQRPQNHSRPWTPMGIRQPCSQRSQPAICRQLTLGLCDPGLPGAADCDRRLWTHRTPGRTSGSATRGIYLASALDPDAPCVPTGWAHSLLPGTDGRNVTQAHKFASFEPAGFHHHSPVSPCPCREPEGRCNW